MSKPVSTLYLTIPDNISKKLDRSLTRGCDKSTGQPQLFFRADDIGIPSNKFAAMIDLFKRAKLPLCLATVPAWLNKERLKTLFRETGSGTSQWCWHQHGYVHKNFEPFGKKQEFGESRPATDISGSIKQGQNRLETLLADKFVPLFTPPWNRCSDATISSLIDLGFLGMSRNRGARPISPDGFPDFQVDVDLHTRKETAADEALANLLTELEKGLETGRCGIMLHHQRMNRNGFIFLEQLLEAVNKESRIANVHFADLLL